MKNNAPLTKDFFDLLFLVQDHMRDVVREKDADLSPVQIMIVRTLFISGEIPQRDLVAQLGRDKSQIARLIKDLEFKGIVLRRPSTHDRRVMLIQAAGHVRAAIETFSAHENDLVQTMLSGVPKDEIKIFSDVLRRMKNNLAPS